MPIYEYVCEDCKSPFERIVLKTTERVSCPKCGSARHNMRFSVVSTPQKAGNGDVSAGSSCCASGGCGCN